MNKTYFFFYRFEPRTLMVAGASRSFRDATATLPRHRARLPAPAPLAPHAPRAHRTVRWPRCSSSPCSLGALLRSMLQPPAPRCRASDEQYRGKRVGKAIRAQTAKRHQPAFARVADAQVLEQHPAMPRQRWENWWRAQRQQQQQPLRPQSQHEEQQQQHGTVDLCVTAVKAAAACKAAASKLVSLVRGRLDVLQYMISCSLTFADRRQRPPCRCGLSCGTMARIIFAYV